LFFKSILGIGVLYKEDRTQNYDPGRTSYIIVLQLETNV